MSPIELAAKAAKDELRRQDVLYEDEEDWNELMMSGGERADLAAMLRAALGALREPTAAMIQAGVLGDPLGCDVDPEDYAMIYGRIWSAMLHAALSEGVTAKAEPAPTR